MAEFEESPRRTQRDPGVTHVDRPAGETRRDPAGTSNDPLQPAFPATTFRDAEPGGGPLVRLPGTLAQRFTVVGELPVQGAESDLMLVRGSAAADAETEYVVKIFRRGYGADREVWRKLPELGSANVVRILETGHADGRDYEVIEYAAAGNLRSLMASGVSVTEVLSQLAAGLDCLHRSGIVHRDLKPENVLVADVQPLRLVITDFGLSKAIEQSVVFASSSRTLAYAAPESLSGQVSPARDWWSLGMIVRELVTGRPPFLGMSETAVVDHLATRPIGGEDITDPRLRLLCQGLLTRDPRRRWGGAEVAQWLDGRSPAVAEDPVPERRLPAGPGLAFSGRRYTDRTELARALVEQWDTAARYFFGRGESGEAWRSLRDWLGFLPDDSRIELIDAHLTEALPPDVKLLHLVRWLDPSLPPHFLGRRVTAEDLPRLAALANDPTHADHRVACVIGRSLWQHRLLPALAGFADAADLTDIDARWRGRVDAWNQLTGWLRERLPPQVTARLPDAGAPGRDDPPVVLLTLLALAASPAETGRTLADAAARARASVHEPVPWYRWLADGAGDDPLRLLAVVRAAPDAVIEVEARRRDLEAAQRRIADRRRHWEEAERRRLAGRRAAITRAVLWSLPLILIWFGGSWLAVQLVHGQGAGSQNITGQRHSTTDPTALFFTVATIAFVVQLAVEVLIASRQGRDYLALGPWSVLAKTLGATGRGLSQASHSMSGTVQRTGRRGCGMVLLLGLVPVLLIAVLLTALLSLLWLMWLLVLVAVPLGHVVSAGIRHGKWNQSHEQARRETLGAAT
ncbi:serine/threonine-protein kinase [Actinomadura sp. HBU206391]|uniref:serine/threonine-protein kinase n=1 Tax=Actinomadura sp. HBU206391 TaxID=2731692 RepID=UPI00164F4CCD|nr:protein kinase [Actinomadura sp. HBU206391]MBC6457495.1 serine/threonine-protein kinase [Actinomadura sp. HBU206391]